MTQRRQRARRRLIAQDRAQHDDIGEWIGPHRFAEELE
jgi:hypothetical protein